MMGIFGTFQSRKALVSELIHGYGDEVFHSCLKHCLRGNVLWSVWESHNYESGEKVRYLRCDLLMTHGGNWSYKPLGEEAGPCYYTCPLSYLKMVPVVRNQAWRDRVMAEAAAKPKHRKKSTWERKAALYAKMRR
jgi:hypothetical protein